MNNNNRSIDLDVLIDSIDIVDYIDEGYIYYVCIVVGVVSLRTHT